MVGVSILFSVLVDAFVVFAGFGLVAGFGRGHPRALVLCDPVVTFFSGVLDSEEVAPDRLLKRCCFCSCLCYVSFCGCLFLMMPFVFDVEDMYLSKVSYSKQ